MTRVVWLNGSFGAGKSTVAELLAERLPDAQLFDPEPLGTALQLSRSDWGALDDFQEIPEWRTATVAAIQALDGIAVVPMTVHEATVFAETIGALRRAGVQLDHFTLVAPETVVADRIHTREGDRSWELARVERCVAALAAPRFAVHVDATGSPETVASSILDRLA